MATPFSNPFAPKGEVSTSKDKAGKPAGNQSADDIESFLDDDKVDDKGKLKVEDDDDKEELETKGDKEKSEEDDEDKDDKDKKDEIKLKEDDDDDEEKEKLDLKEDNEKDIIAPPRRKEIEKEFPEFFKKFPFFDKMMFRDRAYTEMFGSFDEAKAIYAKVDSLNEFESELLSGNTKNVLSTVKETDPKAFDKIVDTYLKTLHDIDPEAYKDVTGNFAKQIILGMADLAKRKDDKELDKAAKLLHEFLFDTDKWEPIKVRVKEEKSEEADKIQQERVELMKERFESARDSLTVKVDNVLKSTIAEYIDPRGLMTAYEKRNAVNEALDQLHKKIAGDINFKKNLDRLWKGAFGDKFSENSLNGIKKSYLGKARGVLADVIKEVRSNVLKDNRSKGKEKEEEKEETPRERKNVNAGRPHQQTTKANERKQGESVEDFLSRD